MHKSRLAGFIIDCQTPTISTPPPRSGRSALGMPIDAKADAGRAATASSTPARRACTSRCRRSTHPSRVHLDIETDDIEAEVQRLEALGAKRVEQGPHLGVMEAPTGQRFCVVRPQRTDFAERANRGSSRRASRRASRIRAP